MTLEKLKYLQSEGLITLRPNTDESLFIANYTPKVQYEKLWTPEVMQCRGLIIDKNDNIIARPFPKFFNIEEHTPEEIPNEPFEVYEKLDGSLGILYFYQDKPFIATRGSFESEQAIKANEILQSKYSDFPFDTRFTYLFEIIYPQNRIVVDYGETEDLILLSVIHTSSGNEFLPDNSGFPNKVRRYDGINDLSKLRDNEEFNKEGFVIRFQSGFRVKMKYAEYVRLHKIITQVSNKSIWEYLKTGQPFDEILKKVPDEFYNWVKQTKQKLEEDFIIIKYCAINMYEEHYKGSESRKDFALWAIKQKYPNLLFKLLDEKSIDEDIWKILKPQFEKPFKVDL